MMETYAERLQREELETYAEKLQNEKKEKMTNYDMDQLRREGKIPDHQKRKKFAEDIIESEKDKTVDIELELSDGDFLHLAKAAHERNITLNQLCVDVLKSSFNDLDYRFEHQLKPQLLNETK